MLPMVRQMLHAMSSLKTNGVAPSSIQTVPANTEAMSTPNALASAFPMMTGPRMRKRIRHSSKEVNRPVNSHAAIRYGAVSLPSSVLVKARTGMRMRDGNRPKYVYSRPPCTKASMPMDPLANHKWPWNMARA